MLPLLYPMMVGYELRLKDIIKNAFIMSAARFPRMVLARLITLIPIAVLFAGLFVGNGIVVLVIVFYYLLFGFAFSRLVYASFANGIFDRYLNPHIEGAEVRAGLRPLSEEDEILDDEEVDVGLQKRKLDLAHRVLDVAFRKPSLAGQLLKNVLQF